MKSALKWISFTLVLFTLLGCSLFSRLPAAALTPEAAAPSQAAPQADNTVEPAKAVPTAEATQPAASATPQPVTPQIDTSSLLKYVQKQLKPGIYESIQVLPLATLPDKPSLWAVYSSGMRNFEAKDSPSHFVAIYTQNEGGEWEQLSKLDLSTGDNDVSPDYLDPKGVQQVQVEPSRVWLSVEGGIGAHGGVFILLSFDGQQLRVEVKNSNDSPGAGRLEDINHDGIPEAILNVSDNYVFCYACSVRKYAYQVYRWDATQQHMVLVELADLGAGQPKAVAEANQQAVALAKAGLWKDALAQANQAMQAAAQDAQADSAAVTWNLALIQLHADALGKAVAESPYPLLANVFYGDYAAAVDRMRAIKPDQIFTLKSPLIVGTPAEGSEDALSGYLMDSTNAAIQQEPNLAPAYFLRGWARYLKDSSDPQAKADVATALSLAPQDELYKASAAVLK
jgi:hypothetical protein